MLDVALFGSMGFCMLQLKYTCEKTDWDSYRKLCERRANGWRGYAFWIGLALLASALPQVFSHKRFPDIDDGSFGEGVFVAILVFSLWVIVFRFLFPASEVKAKGTILGDRELRLADDGIETSGTGASATYTWDVVEGLSKSNDIYVIWVEPAGGLIVPTRAFTNQSTAAEFASFVESRIQSQT